MAEVDWRRLEREWQANPGDLHLLEQTIVAFERAGQQVPEAMRAASLQVEVYWASYDLEGHQLGGLTWVRAVVERFGREKRFKLIHPRYPTSEVAFAAGEGPVMGVEGRPIRGSKEVEWDATQSIADQVDEWQELGILSWSCGSGQLPEFEGGLGLSYHPHRLVDSHQDIYQGTAYADSAQPQQLEVLEALWRSEMGSEPNVSYEARLIGTSSTDRAVEQAVRWAEAVIEEGTGQTIALRTSEGDLVTARGVFRPPSLTDACIDEDASQGCNIGSHRPHRSGVCEALVSKALLGVTEDPVAELQQIGIGRVEVVWETGKATWKVDAGRITFGETGPLTNLIERIDAFRGTVL